MNLNNVKFIVASGPVIIENNKVLLNRHGHPDEKDDKDKGKYWKFPGGKVENSNYSKQKSILEKICKLKVKEEMGIVIKDLVAIKPMMIKHPDKKNTVVILIHYLAKRIGKIKPGSDIKEWKWFSISKLPKNCAPNIKPVIEKYKGL